MESDILLQKHINNRRECSYVGVDVCQSFRKYSTVGRYF